MADRITYVAFVRAVMLGREGLHRQVLLDLFEEAGAVDPVSYITTGNVSFELEPGQLQSVVAQVDAAIEAVVDHPAELFVRTLEELQALVALDAFAEPPFEGVTEEVVTFFRGRVPESVDVPIVSPRGDTSTFLATDRELFSVVREVDGRASAPGGRLEKLVGERLTTRSITTIERIVAALS